MKALRITMPDGSGWQVPAEIVARNIAEYWVKAHGADRDEEIRDAMENDHTLLDWARGEMNWSDVAAHAVQISPASSVDYQAGWVNGPMEMVEIPDVDPHPGMATLAEIEAWERRHLTLNPSPEGQDAHSD